MPNVTTDSTTASGEHNQASIQSKAGALIILHIVHLFRKDKHCHAEEDQQDTYVVNFNFLLTIQLTYSYLVSTAKPGGTDPPLALGKLGQEGHKVKASLCYETKTLSQRNEK